MNQNKYYTFDGIEINVPLQYDEQSHKFIEDYRRWIEDIIYTPMGHPILFAGEDACEFGECDDAEDCHDCGSCVFYKRADEHTWIGVCLNENKKKIK